MKSCKVWLERNAAKSGEPRVFSFDALETLVSVLQRQREATTALER